MEIIKVVPRGFCKGVVGAINIAKKTRQEYPDKPIYILGMLVHNKYIIDALDELNIKTIDTPNKNRIELLDEIDEGVVIFTAHGISEQVKKAASAKGLICVDASCSDVLTTRDVVKEHLDNDQTIIYIGKKGHPEAMALIEDYPMIHLVESIEDLKSLNLSKEKPIFATNQTTMSILDVQAIYQYLEDNYDHVEICEEICNATRTRQEAILALKDQNVDLLIIIGDSRSNNSRRLKAIGESINIPQVVFINTINDLDFNILNDDMKVAISAGASTPTYLINQVIQALENHEYYKHDIEINKIL